MKKTLLFAILSVSIVAISCSDKKQNENGVLLEHATVDKYFNIELTDSLQANMMDVDGYSIHNKAELIWPVSINGQVPTELQRTILKLALNDSTSTTLEEAMKKYETSYAHLDKKDIKECEETDKENAKQGETMQSATVKLAYADNRLYIFSIFNEDYSFGAAHGMYTERFINYDLTTGKIITINDLVNDKTKLAEIIKNVRSKEKKAAGESDDTLVLDEFPVSNAFTLAHYELQFIYQPYEIASYAEGIQTINVPIYELNTAGILTDYAKNLLGLE